MLDVFLAFSRVDSTLIRGREQKIALPIFFNSDNSFFVENVVENFHALPKKSTGALVGLEQFSGPRILRPMDT